MTSRKRGAEAMHTNGRLHENFAARLTGGLLGLSLAAAVFAAPAQAGNPAAPSVPPGDKGAADLAAVNAGMIDNGEEVLNVDALRAFAAEQKNGRMLKLGQRLRSLYDEHASFVAQQRAQGTREIFRTNAPMLMQTGELVVVDAVADEDPEALLADLEALGLQHGSVYGRVVSGKMPIAALDKASELTSLRFAHTPMVMTNAGSVNSEAVKAMVVNRAKKVYGAKGRGVRVGVLSDSYDCLGGAAADIASKDLPPAKQIIVLDDTACPGNDEGRAMMQLIRDIAPSAKQSFHTAFNGLADFANGIIELSQKTKGKSDVIVDDIIYLAEPMFQDGIAAQAVDKVKNKGIPYFSSAGNNGRGSWESGNKGFVDSGTTLAGIGTLHDFDTSSGKDYLQRFMLGTGNTVIILQWDEPFASASTTGAGSRSDVDFIAVELDGTIIAYSASLNIGGDAVEGIGLSNPGSPRQINLVIPLFEGPAPKFMKYVIYGPGSNDVTDPPASYPVEYDTKSGTIYGHALAKGATAVGAVHYKKTPPFGTKNPVIEPFSSAGGTPIFFNKKGVRKAKQIRKKPEISAVDGVSNTFFGQRDANGVFNPAGTHFFGTSAAAPNAAAVAALILEIDPAASVSKINNHLKITAKDMNDPATGGGDPGFDFGTGAGLINAFKAVKRADALK